jgi:hypothetical protein
MTLGRPISETEGFIKALYYGEQGTAKTTCMATMANIGLCVAVDLEVEGWLSRPLESRGINTQNIIKFAPTSEAELEQVYWEVKGMFDDGLPVVGLAIDHVTELQELIVREARMSRVAKERKGLLKAGKTEIANDIDEDWTSRDDYGTWTTKARKLTRLFRDLPCHVAYGAHVRNAENSPDLVPSITEKFRNDLLGSCNMVIAMLEKQNPHSPLGTGFEYVGLTKKIDRYKGKDRFGVLPDVMPYPTMERLIAMTRGELDLSTDPHALALEKRLNG